VSCFGYQSSFETSFLPAAAISWHSQTEFLVVRTSPPDNSTNISKTRYSAVSENTLSIGSIGIGSGRMWIRKAELGIPRSLGTVVST
jgi:hypothetical protein